MTTFPSIPTVLPEGQLGVARVAHLNITEHDARFTRMREMATGGREQSIPVGQYAQLFVESTLMMSDTPMERRSNVAVVRMARGHVLIAGLGIGMILHPILAKPEVTRVTVVEKYGDVIKLVGPTLPQEKLELIEADILTWVPTKGAKYDTIYFDIWPDITGDNLEEMATLHRRFARRKTPGAWMDSWKRDELLAQKRREKANPRGWWR